MVVLDFLQHMKFKNEFKIYYTLLSNLNYLILLFFSTISTIVSIIYILVCIE